MIRMKMKAAGITRAGKRSQISMSDIFLAVSVFVILIGAVVFLYNSYGQKFESRKSFNRMQLSAMEAADVLAKTNGLPSNWELNPDMTEAIGLAGNERNISEQKLNAFLNISYNRSRELMGISQDYYFKIVYGKGDFIAEKGINSTGGEAVGVERRVMYRGENAILYIVLWEKGGWMENAG